MLKFMADINKYIEFDLPADVELLNEEEYKKFRLMRDFSRNYFTNKIKYYEDKFYLKHNDYKIENSLDDYTLLNSTHGTD